MTPSQRRDKLGSMDRVERRLIEHRSCASRVEFDPRLAAEVQQPSETSTDRRAPPPNLRKARRGAYFLSGRGLIARATATKAAHRIFCRSRQLNLPQNNKLDLCLSMLKMHKWRGEVVKMPMHYALCTFAHKCTDRAPFPPGPDAFSEIYIITICIITFSTVCLFFPSPSCSQTTPAAVVPLHVTRQTAHQGGLGPRRLSSSYI